jgi:hypothetical protein
MAGVVLSNLFRLLMRESSPRALAAAGALPHKGRMTSQETRPAGKDFARTAMLVAVCFVVPLAGLTAWSAKDRRATAENFAKVSAVGDAPTFQRPGRLDRAAPLVTFNGFPLYPARDKDADIRDSKMRRAGVVDGTETVVYQCVDPGEDDSFFLKTGVSRYVRLKAAPEKAE